MLLTPHIATGAAIGSKLTHPYLIGIVSFLSHLILDCIPHWEYYPEKVFEKFEKFKIKDKDLQKNFLYIFIDGCLGLSVVGGAFYFGFIKASLLIPIAWGIFFSLLPDPAYVGAKILSNHVKMFSYYKKFHKLYHFNKNNPPSPAFGIGIQAVMVFLALILLFA